MQEEAEDIVQEAFTKIYINAAKFKKQEGAQFSSWGYRILINTALTTTPKKRRSGQGGAAGRGDMGADPRQKPKAV
jgi:DNA-directed RNA polymerase specialized sigma24 family protein